MKIEVQCPTHGLSVVPLNENGQEKLSKRVQLGKEMHSLLKKIATDTQHPGLVALIGADCTGSHSHGHDCDSHISGHHHEVIFIDGEAIELCDTASLKTLLEALTTELNGCDCDHPQLLGLIEKANSLQAEMAEVSSCTKKYCMSCINEKRPHGKAKKTKKIKFKPGAVQV